jgi:uncharacterized heparinase superfamily protein
VGDVLAFQKYFHTIRYLRPRQVFCRIWRKFRVSRAIPLTALDRRSLIFSWNRPLEKRVCILDADRFLFLNQEYSLDWPIGWNHPEREKLWLYNLHYFDDLCAADGENRNVWHRDLIRRWVEDNPPGEGNGWEPYPIALRAVNWIKWVLNGHELAKEELLSLVMQVRHLRRDLEYHLLGNHLFANGKALVFAGLFFQGAEAEAWLKKGLKILRSEVAEQILPDGGNFERSPMYHAIILEDLLDLINVLKTYGHSVPEEWKGIAQKMRQWLQTMRHPDGEIVLFNDAAFGIAPTPAAIEHYADRLGLAPLQPSCESLVPLAETGYIRLQKGPAVAFLDVGLIGPDYIPGHAHADTLNFELSLFGQRLVVDSGTSTYEKNAERQRQRGTSSHNTVSINGEDSSETWGGFRVARRARPFDLAIDEEGGKIRIACSHSGYHRLPGKPTHHREWRMDKGKLVVRDSIEGKFREGVARYHFHPEVNLKMTNAGQGKGTLPGGQSFSFQIVRGNAQIVDTTYHPEFNVSLPNKCLEITLDGPEVKVTFSWT